MKIVLFTHPKFLGSQSMPRYAKMLAEGMESRGHKVTIWTPKAYFYKLPLNFMKKWLSYIDQYILFPLEIKLKLVEDFKDTIFVFADQALGPWVPLVKNKPHVVHCHDFLALISAQGKIPENPTGKSGKKYQNYIRRGFSRGKHFIAISQKTLDDLKKLHIGIIESATVCYNGLNRTFEILDSQKSREALGNYLKIDLSKGYILHVGGNQFYKNRRGVIEIYNAWRSNSNFVLPLVMIGANPSKKLKDVYANSSYNNDIHLITGLEDDYINQAYSGSTCLLFPSLDEGFGWPIAEAIASGTLVITTNRAPMTEVLGNANFFQIERRPFEESLVEKWANESSNQITKIVNLSHNERLQCINIGLESNRRFDTELFLNEIEKEYQTILKKSTI